MRAFVANRNNNSNCIFVTVNNTSEYIERSIQTTKREIR